MQTHILSMSRLTGALVGNDDRDIRVTEPIRVIPRQQKKAVHIDRVRMDRALSAPSFTVPSGLTPEQIRQFILKSVNGEK